MSRYRRARDPWDSVETTLAEELGTVLSIERTRRGSIRQYWVRSGQRPDGAFLGGTCFRRAKEAWTCYRATVEHSRREVTS